MAVNHPFSGKNLESIVVFAMVAGIAFSWLVFDVVSPILTTPWSLGLPYLVNLFFELLITGLILFAIFHNGLDLVYKAASGVGRRVEGPKVKRFDLNQRVQHIWLFTSTAILAVTGFAQLYYEAWGALSSTRWAVWRLAWTSTSWLHYSSARSYSTTLGFTPRSISQGALVANLHRCP